MYFTIRALVARNEKRIHILKNALAIQLCNQTYQTSIGQMDLSTSAIAVDEIYSESANKTADSILEDIDILCRRGRLTEAVGTLHHLNPADLKARFDVYSCLLQWCVQMKALPEGKRVHSHIIKMNFSPGIVLGNNLINMYAKCGSLVDAQQVFDKMPLKNMCSWNTTLAGYTKSGNLEYAMEMFDKMPEQDAVSWTVMIASYRQHGYYKGSLHLYEQMLEAGTMPNQFTFTSVLSACTSLAVLEQGKRVHGHIVKFGLCPYVAVGNALVSLYAKCGSIEEARRMFDNMPVRNVYSWNTLIGAYTQSGDLHFARALFDKMPARDVVSWNSMISGYSQHGFDKEGIQLFVEMQQDGMKPDLFTCTSVLTACANIESLKQGKKTHAYVIRIGLEMDGTVGNALVSMYAKCGNTEDAHFVFEKMPELNVVSWTAMIAGYVKCGSIEHARHLFERMPERDVVSWTSMIVGYAQYGDDKEVLQLFEEMLLSGPKPNNFTFACVLSVIASIAAFENGKQVHAHTLKVGFDSYTSVGNSLITMYAKCGNIEGARKVFKIMPEQDAVSWTAIIAGNAQHGFGKEALQLFDKMLWVGMKPDSITFLGVLMACTHAGLVMKADTTSFL